MCVGGVFFLLFFLCLDWCVFVLGVSVSGAVCFSVCLSVTSPLLTQVLSGELQQSCGSADRCMGGGGGGISVCLSLYLSLPLSLSPPLRYYCTVIYLHKLQNIVAGFLRGLK